MNWYQIALARLGWQEITLWYRMLDGFSFNHLENGHASGDTPKPRSEMQKQAWKGGKWSKRLWYAKQEGTRLVVL